MPDELELIQAERLQFELLLQKIKESITKATTFEDQFAGFKAQFESLAGKADSMLDEASKIIDRFDDVERVAGSIRTYADQIGEFTEQITDQIEAVGVQIDDSIDVLTDVCQSEILEQFEAIESFTTETVDEICSEVDKVLDEVEEVQTKTAGSIEQIFTNALPGGFGKETEQFLNGIQGLKENGLAEVNKMQEKLEAITEKTRTLTDLIEQVKPVLEVARQVL